MKAIKISLLEWSMPERAHRYGFRPSTVCDALSQIKKHLT
jgi:hypothetical protein